MKNTVKIVLFSIAALIFANSCDQLGLTGKEEEKKVIVEKKAEKPKISCELTEVDYKSTIERNIKITYKDKKPLNVSAFFKQSEHKIDVSFDYKNNKLNRVTTLSSGAYSEYVYDTLNQIVEIKTDGSAMPIKFKYNDKGQIINQISFNDGKTYMTYEYSYNDKGLPIKCKRLNAENALVMEIDFEYDTKKNPFIGLTHMVNNAELMYGYPIGNSKHNLTKITTTYNENQAWQVNGEFKKPGEKDIVSIKYEYNEHGYPVKFSSGTDVISLKYNCSETKPKSKEKSKKKSAK